MNPSFLKRAVSLTRQRWFELGLLLLFAAVSVQYSIKVLDKKGSAFIRWRQQDLQLDEGEDIYRRYIYPNPPIMALMLKPLAEMPPLAGALCWFYLKVGMTLLALHWTFRMVESHGLAFPAWGKAVAAILSLRPIIGDLSHGNVNLLILFLVVATLYAYHRKWDFTAGVVLALAIACKVTPALFLPYFLWKRGWKTLAGCAGGLVLFFLVVPSCFLGWEQNNQLLGSWADQMVKPYLVEGKVFYSEHNNQSLPGLVFRLTTHSPSVSDYVEDVYTPLDYHNIVALDTNAAKWIVRMCMVLFAGLILWTCRTRTDPRASWRLAAEFSLVLLGMLLFSERTWKHHCVTLLLPMTVIVYYLSACRPSPRSRWYLIGTLAAVVVLMASTSTGLLPILDVMSLHSLAYGAYVWAFVLLVAALMVMLRTRDMEGADGGAKPSSSRDAMAERDPDLSFRARVAGAGAKR